MCRGCWERNGSPGDWTPKMARLIVLIRELYRLHPTAGPLHVALDDWNVEHDAHLTPVYVIPAYGSCPGFPDDYDERTHELCDEISRLLLTLTTDQRLATLAYTEGLLPLPDDDDDDEVTT